MISTIVVTAWIALCPLQHFPKSSFQSLFCESVRWHNLWACREFNTLDKEHLEAERYVDYIFQEFIVSFSSFIDKTFFLLHDNVRRQSEGTVLMNFEEALIHLPEPRH